MNKDKKRGKFSIMEEEFIAEHCAEQTDEWIAEALRRTVDSIRDRRARLNVKHEMPELTNEDEALSYLLFSRPYWHEIQRQFTTSELRLYEYHWVALVKQFKEDITHTEELQINKLVNLELLMNRISVEKNSVFKDIERIDRRLSELYALAADDGDNEELSNLEVAKTNYMASQSSRTSEYDKLLQSYQKMMHQLKATRDQRYEHVQNSKTSFAEWLKLHNEEKLRKKDAHEMELMRIAMNRERTRLSQPHKYEDGMTDLPFLTPESVTNARELQEVEDQECQNEPPLSQE